MKMEFLMSHKKVCDWFLKTKKAPFGAFLIFKILLK